MSKKGTGLQHAPNGAPYRKKKLDALAKMDVQEEYDFILSVIEKHPGISNRQLIKAIKPHIGNRQAYTTRRWAALREALQHDSRVIATCISSRSYNYRLVEEPFSKHPRGLARKASTQIPAEEIEQPMDDQTWPTISMEGTLPDPIHMTVRSPEGVELSSGTFSSKAGITMMNSSATRIEVRVVRRSDGTTETHLDIVVE